MLNPDCKRETDRRLPDRQESLLPLRTVIRIKAVPALKLTELLSALVFPEERYMELADRYIKDEDMGCDWWTDDTESFPGSVWLSPDMAISICHSVENDFVRHKSIAYAVVNLLQIRWRNWKEEHRQNMTETGSVPEDITEDRSMAEVLDALKAFDEAKADPEPSAGAASPAAGLPDPADAPALLNSDAGHHTVCFEAADHPEKRAKHTRKPSSAFADRFPMTGSCVASIFGISRLELHYLLLQNQLIYYKSGAGFFLRYPEWDANLAVIDRKHDKGGRNIYLWTRAGLDRITEILAGEGIYPVVEESRE